MSKQLWSAGVRLIVNGEVPVTVYNSLLSKLRVAVAEVPGPMVKGILSFVTETHNDDGLPHTLEHLVFMGSKKYPVKGILDIIANRCLASGTNAYTAQDHTAYTLTTVGSEGFLKVLPVYIDHVLSPTLTAEQFITEVHHINGEGKDAGVVYSEMQNYESDMEEIIVRKRKELFYPEGNPYRVETGGRLYALRTTCNNEAVRKFHSQFYHLNNMMIIVCGIINHERLLNTIAPVVEESLSTANSSFRQPFSEEIKTIRGPHEAVIECPSDDDEFGIVEMSWVGPPAKDMYNIRALGILNDYFECTAVAPLQKVFIQLATPYACSASFSINLQSISEIVLTFCGVPVEKLSEIKPRYFKEVVEPHKKSSGFDMERLGFVIDQATYRAYSKMETCGHEKIFDLLITHQIYGYENSNLTELLDEVGDLKRIKNEPVEFWTNLVKKFYNENYVCVMGKPSEEKVEEYAKKEKARIEQQRKRLGKEGLAEKDRILKEAIEKNSEHKPSSEVLNDLMVRDLEKFNTFNITLVRNNENITHRHLNCLNGLNAPAFIYTLPTNFVDVHLVWDTKNIPAQQRRWLILLFELMFESPARVDDKILTYEEVTKLFTRDLLLQSISLGVSSSFSQYLNLHLKVPYEKFEMLPKWANIFLKGIVFDPQRVLVAGRKLVAQAIEDKRDGYTMVSLLHKMAVYEPGTNSNYFLCGTVQLEKFHNEVVKRIEKDPDWVLAQLEELRKSLLSSPMTLHMSSDSKILDMPSTGATWSFLNDSIAVPEAEFFESAGKVSFRKDRAGNHLLASVGSCESSFLYQSIVFDHQWGGETLIATMLLSQYLTQTEGPLYRGVRGNGLAYGSNIYVRPDSKMLLLSIYRSADLIQAYEHSKKIVLDTVAKGDFNMDEFEAAKRSLVSEIIEDEDTVKSACKQAILSQFRGTELDHNKSMCHKIWNMTVEEVLKYGALHLQDLFDEKKCSRAVVVNPVKIEEIKKAFHGITVTNLDDVSSQFSS
uniref:Mitochondrial presequence protease n=1 Tax=Syphacia muris TaxID=451379 RepID=A0A0N5ALS8_9BILA